MMRAALITASAAIAAWSAMTPAKAVTPPALTAGKITGDAIAIATPVASPTIKFSYTAPGTLVSWSFTFTSPHGQTHGLYGSTVQAPGEFAGYAVPAGTSGTITFSQETYPFSLYAEGGTWMLTGAALTDLAGNTTTYTAAELAGLFPKLALTVTTALTPDITPPTVSAGKILNKTVSVSGPYPYVGAQVTAMDNLSGAYSGQLYLLMPDGQPWGGFYNDPAETGTYGPQPVTNGTLQFGEALTPSAPAGTWTIAGYQVCDAAGNCLTVMGAAGVKSLFHTTTITVTP
jgi:hypothetical protein